jgi:hypothetical protein
VWFSLDNFFVLFVVIIDLCCQMQSHNEGYASGGCAVKSPESSLRAVGSRSPSGFQQLITDAVIRAAADPAVQTTYKKHLESAFREPWFADLIRGVVLPLLATPSDSGSSQSNLSQSSQSSAGSGAVAQDNGSQLSEAVSSQAIEAGGSNLMPGSSYVEANVLWDVPCPCCNVVAANENAFVEHMKLIVINRHNGANPKIKCVMRTNNDRHVKLLQRWTQNRLSWCDSVCEFVTEMRSNCNPGSKRVYRPGGTGNNRKVKKFVAECLSLSAITASQHVGAAVYDHVAPRYTGSEMGHSPVRCAASGFGSGDAGQSPVLFGDGQLGGSAPSMDDIRMMEFMANSSDGAWSAFLSNDVRF